jgi:hypothetical protein
LLIAIPQRAAGYRVRVDLERLCQAANCVRAGLQTSTPNFCRPTAAPIFISPWVRVGIFDRKTLLPFDRRIIYVQCGRR